MSLNEDDAFHSMSLLFEGHLAAPRHDACYEDGHDSSYLKFYVYHRIPTLTTNTKSTCNIKVS